MCYLVKDLVWNHRERVVFRISGDSGHLNKVKNLDVGRVARWNPTGKSSGGPPSIFQGAINFPHSLLHASGEGDQARRDPGRSEELQAVSPASLCVRSFPTGGTAACQRAARVGGGVESVRSSGGSLEES